MHFKDELSSQLPKAILQDFCRRGLLPLMLMLLVFISAMAIVFTTHHSRLVINERAALQSERLKLDDEWRNLLLEEMTLSAHSRVEYYAKKELEMQRSDGSKEIIIKE
ncbi:cell division protein FtsL [Vibrio sp.]|nr:cell division protein FtsL [Vibrio sp.]